MDLTIVIVSYNVSDLLRNCLAAVFNSAKGINSEVYVVDNNSSDDSCKVVIEEFPYARLVRNNFNAGYAAANNQAIRLARGRYVLLLNPDTLVGEDCFIKCIKFMDSHPEAGAMGVKMIDGDGKYLPESKRSLPSVYSSFFKSFGLAFLFPSSRLFNNYYLISVGADETAKTEVISGAFMLIRKNAFEKTGLLDEDYFMYGEDVDLSYRIIKKGFFNYYYPEVIITHYKGCSTQRNGYSDLFHFYKAMRIYVNKRSAEGEFRYSAFFLHAGIYLRESLALTNRFIRVSLNRCLLP
jgi:O-antigen biosynthesis protein